MFPAIGQLEQVARAALMPALYKDFPDGLADAGPSIEHDDAQHGRSPHRWRETGPKGMDVFT